MVKTVCRYFLSSLRNKDANIGEHQKNSSNFEQRGFKYANTWGGGGRAGDQKSFQNDLYCILFVLRTICFHSAFTFMRL